MRVNLRRACRERGDDGFTLIELVISVALLGIVSAALFGIVLQYAKTTRDTGARLTESTDQQFISTYWQDDVSSLGRRTFTPATGTFSTDQSVFVGSAGPGGCGSSVGSVAVALAWNEFAVGVAPAADPWVSTPHQVAYVTVPNGSRFLLRRVRCKGGVAVGLPLTVAHNLTGTPTIGCDTTCGAATPPNRVSMTFTVKDKAHLASQGYTTTVSADRRQQ
ncbi:prepilin-type N-terminal cleavage/methylation domain-containing protein [Nocardioides panacis]|uniref:Prepilin-type N-terminal cleavage/methylation domain-containing protein n=1 Tax=Nocardioides panacis TaxID=2849501 RepID=A0A975T051_9ACTN|nr:prepilin-type N-terminal cleavage/methylation domain-containing protein [Nocardioides panacis]QWZ08454.1 prepilin-type N-terminal cleavage/methylation domain-containing protein [Nocardioides panacis]